MVHALAQWGQTYGVQQVYLQVMVENIPALALYRRFGFETLYHYYYRALV
jgi:ribosomal protein S18 acetylase RimI-like enzyme